MREDMRADLDEQRKKTMGGISAMDLASRKARESARPRPKAMKYFDDMAAFDTPRLEELRKFKENGGKVVGTLCVFTPNELITAAGAKVVRLCSGYYDSIHPANELLGDAGLCPLVKSTLGNKMVEASPLFELCDLVVGPATCDGKMKLGEILSDFVPVVMLNVPRVKTGDTTAKMWLEEIKYLMYRLEDLTGQKITRSSIRKAIEQYNEAVRLWGKLVETRRRSRVSLWGSDMILLSQLVLVDDVDRWCTKIQELIDEIERMNGDQVWIGRDDSPRILLAGSPIVWPNWKIPNLLEESGGVIIADELCSSTRLLVNPLVIDEASKSGMLRAIAERYLYPCSCPCFTPNDERIIRLNNMIDDYKVDGVLFHVLRGCHLNNLEASRIDRFLRSKSVSMLKIETEYDEGDIEQLRTRVEAFLEMIRSRKEFERTGKEEVETIKGFEDERLEEMKELAEEKRLFVTTKQKSSNRAEDGYVVGIDVGALYTKIILVRNGKILDTMMEATTMEPNALAWKMYRKMLRKNRIKKGVIKGIVATGQGKGSIRFASMETTEISAFARGAKELLPSVRMVIDVGGQGIRITELDPAGVVSSFKTNDKCSSGTGTFLDTMAASLGVDADAMGPLGCSSNCPSCVVATCTVFAESEMVSLVAKKVPKEDIIGGLNQMVAKKVSAVAKSVGIKGDVLLAGGVARNEQVEKELRSRFKHEVFIPENPQYVGAYGAALSYTAKGGDV
jgi:predicted CoA-substrate-specific enzyme activase